MCGETKAKKYSARAPFEWQWKLRRVLFPGEKKQLRTPTYLFSTANGADALAHLACRQIPTLFGVTSNAAPTQRSQRYPLEIAG